MPKKINRSGTHLTKSRFKLGLDCPTKLYYSNNSRYINTLSTDSFMEALAAGGYQIGELAKCYHPDGIDIETLESDEAVALTTQHLTTDSITLFEAAVKFGNFLVRIDLLVKTNKHFDLYEVKAKAIDPNNPNMMKQNGTGPVAGWNAYLMDVAFQHYVLQCAYPEHTITSHLQLVDKTKAATSDGMNAKFRIVKHGKSRVSIEVDPTITDADLASKLLTSINVDDAVNWIQTQAKFEGRSFTEQVHFLDQIVQNNTREQGLLGKRCKSCEFSPDKSEITDDQLSGYRECWTSLKHWTDEDFEKQTVFDIWNLRSADKLMEVNKLDLNTLSTDDIPIKSSDTPGLSQSERQWLQINKSRDNDDSAYLDSEGLNAEMNQWQYPLHLIDFETTAPALPFSKGMKPYQTVAFQFSHHLLHESGQVEHIGEFLDATPGVLPNLEFLRTLKAQLEVDNGTVFRFHNHENTVLLSLAAQLLSTSLTDASETDQLIDFIHQLTHESGSNPRIGERDMVDLHQLNLRYFYHPLTRGSNSLKALLPAVLQWSTFLHEKYGQPIYGSKDGIASLNFKNKQWISFEEGLVQDPYASLPPLFHESAESIDRKLSQADRIADGGAAMTAYAHLQHVDMEAAERDALNQGLLRYCELDTLAMVMVIEAWRDSVS